MHLNSTRVENILLTSKVAALSMVFPIKIPKSNIANLNRVQRTEAAVNIQ